MSTDHELIQQLQSTFQAAGHDPTAVEAVLDGKQRNYETKASLALMLVDVEHIQETLLASPRPLTIFGASLALQSFAEELSASWDASQRRHRIQDLGSATMVYAGGGNVLLVAPAKQSKDLGDFLKQALNKHLIDAECSCASLVVSPRQLAFGPDPLGAQGTDAAQLAQYLSVKTTLSNDVSSKGFGALMANLQLQLQQSKGAARAHAFLPGPTSATRCEECARRPRQLNQRGPDEKPQRLCSNCAALRQLGSPARDDSNFIQARSFEDLFGESPRIAYIHVDGRGIGKKLQACSTLRQYHRLSQTLHDIFVKTSKELIRSTYQLSSEGRPTCQIVLCGGDDLLLVLPLTGPKSDVFTFTRLLLQSIESKGKEEGITAGAGIVVTKTLAADYCFRRASELCKEAKHRVKGKKGQSSPSVVNFEFLLSGSPEVHGVAHEHGQSDEAAERSGFALTQRPYPLSDFGRLVDLAREIRNKGIAKAQLMNLRDAFLHDPASARLTFLYQLARTAELREIFFAGATSGLSTAAIPHFVLRPPDGKLPESTALPDLIDISRAMQGPETVRL